MDLSSASFFVYSSSCPFYGNNDGISYLNGDIHPCTDIPSWIFEQSTEIIDISKIHEKIRNYEIVSGIKIGLLRQYKNFSMVILGKYNFSETSNEYDYLGFSNMQETKSRRFNSNHLVATCCGILLENKIIQDNLSPFWSSYPKIVFSNRKKFFCSDKLLSILAEIFPVALCSLISEYRSMQYSRKQLFRILEQEFYSGLSNSPDGSHIKKNNDELSIDNEILDLSGAVFKYKWSRQIKNKDIEKIFYWVASVIAAFCTKHQSIKTLVLPAKLWLQFTQFEQIFTKVNFLPHFQIYMKRCLTVIEPSTDSPRVSNFYMWKEIILYQHFMEQFAAESNKNISVKKQPTRKKQKPNCLIT